MLVITEGVGRHTTRLCGPSESLDLVLIVAISVIEHTCISCCMSPECHTGYVGTVMMYSPRAAGPRDYIITVPTYPL